MGLDWSFRTPVARVESRVIPSCYEYLRCIGSIVGIRVFLTSCLYKIEQCDIFCDCVLYMARQPV